MKPETQPAVPNPPRFFPALEAALGRLNYRLFLALSTLSGCLLSLFFFSPRYALWRGLDIPESYFNPEVNRAAATLVQVVDPLVLVPSGGVNGVLKWRLFFPFLAHFLHLPDSVFLAFPHLGCFLVVGLAIHLVAERSKDRALALMTGALVATTSFFFVSTGWLAYFDSYYVLGILIVSFVRVRWAFFAACLIAPWVDERFLLSLPFCLMVRAFSSSETEGQGPAPVFPRDVRIGLGLAGLYVGVRLISMAIGTDVFSESFIGGAVRTNFLLEVPATIGKGLWHGLRGAWFFLIFGLGAFFVKGKPVFTAAFWAFLLLAFGLIYFFAGDFSRNASFLLPFVVLGVLLLHRRNSEVARVILGLVLVGNLFLPATHVIAGFDVPIEGLRAELESIKNPPPSVDGRTYNDRAVSHFNEGKIKEALSDFELAIRLNPKDPVSYFNRGILYLNTKSYGEAMKDFTVALQKGSGNEQLVKAAQPYLAKATEELAKESNRVPAGAKPE